MQSQTLETHNAFSIDAVKQQQQQQHNNKSAIYYFTLKSLGSDLGSGATLTETQPQALTQAQARAEAQFRAQTVAKKLCQQQIEKLIYNKAKKKYILFTWFRPN